MNMKIHNPIFQIIDIVRVQRKNFEIATKDKSCFVISCRLNGGSIFFLENEEKEIREGDVLYIPAGATYSQRCEEEEIVFIHLNAIGIVPDQIKVVSPENKDGIRELFIRINELWNKKQYFYECMKLFYQILSVTDIITPEAKGDDYLSKAVGYLDEHLCEPELSLEKACRSANICRVYFNKLFKSKYGKTPVRYIHEKRIERAKFLLRSGAYTRAEISELCGFYDVKYFYSVFKAVTGLTTGEYEKGDYDIDTYS